jgi:hypothetical protein
VLEELHYIRSVKRELKIFYTYTKYKIFTGTLTKGIWRKNSDLGCILDFMILGMLNVLVMVVMIVITFGIVMCAVIVVGITYFCTYYELMYMN